MDSSTCTGCGGALRSAARYCPSCGFERGKPGMPKGSRWRLGDRTGTPASGGEGRLTAGIGFLFAGTLAAVALAAQLAQDWGPDITYRFAAMDAGLLFLVGAISCAILGSDAWRASLGVVPEPKWMAIAVPVGILAWGVADLYVRFLASVVGGELQTVYELTPALVLLVVFTGPLLEEWVDRGILWSACLRAGDERMALFATSALFGLSHGLNGGGIVEFPHRFLGGLALGWLRWHSGSIAAPIIAHMTWNALALGV